MSALQAPTGPRAYIGGGNVAGILGVSPYKSPLDEYLTITADADRDLDARTLAFFARRKALEPFAVAAFTAATGLAVTAVNQRTPGEFPWMRAEIDFEPEDGGNGEIKTVHPLAAKDWGESGSDEVPAYVVAQVQHGLMVRARQHCWVHALVGLDDDRIYRIERDDDLITVIRQAEIDFWHRHVLPRSAPAPTTLEDLKRLYPCDRGSELVATADLVHMVGLLRELKAQIKQGEVAQEQMETAIKLALGEHAALIDPATSKPLLTWKAQERRAVDVKRLQAERPDIAEAFTVTTPLRVLRIK